MTQRIPSQSQSRRAWRELVPDGDVRLTRARAILAGVVAGWVAIGIKVLIAEGIDGDPGYIVLFGAVVAAAWIGGLVAGLAATVMSTVTNIFVFVLPVGGLVTGGGRDEFTNLVLYVIVAIGTAVLIGSRRASRDRLADALNDIAALAAAIEQRDERLELMLAASGTGFWEWDVNTGELFWSDAIFRQHGREPAVGAPDFESYTSMIHAEDREQFKSVLGGALETGLPFNLDFRVIWPDQSVHWTHGAGRLVRGPTGLAVRMIGTGQDITEQRRLEKERDDLVAAERRAGAFRESFVDVVSHELRTPITTILGISQILTRPGREAASDDPGLLEDVRAESERLYRLVEDFLVLSRAERGRLEVDAEPLQPRRVIERIVEREAAELPSISIVLDIAPSLPIVAGEETYIEQIVRNLLGNAAKYTAPGSSVLVSAQHEGDAVVVRVLDEGPGVPVQSLERIFDLFYRDPDRARTIAGSGIGLFVCASLVEAMGGRIWALPRPGGGSEFGFTLRVIEPDDEDAPVAPAR